MEGRKEKLRGKKEISEEGRRKEKSIELWKEGKRTKEGRKEKLRKERLMREEGRNKGKYLKT